MPLKIVKDDITKIECDAIVNPTNKDLIPTGGTDAAIHEAAGPLLFQYCRRHVGLSVGEVVATPACDLPCKCIIHTVGPIWQDGCSGERVLLRSCYREAMELAASFGMKSIAFPLISSGAYGYPKNKVMREAIDVISKLLERYEMDVYIVLYDKGAYELSPELYSDVSAYIEDNLGVPLMKNKSASTEAYSPTNAECSSSLLRERRARRAYSERLSDENHSISDYDEERASMSFVDSMEEASECRVSYSKSLKNIFDDMDKGFADTLFYYIDKKMVSDVEAYKSANVSRKTFSKLKCDSSYKPSKVTAVSFAIGLHLSLEETNHLLSTAGMCLSRSDKFDVIIEYFITSGNYETIHDVNEVLYQFDQVLLGV